MAQVLIMPRQGNTVESCIIVDWKKKEGDAVEADTPVVEVETDKATFEVPAGAAGTILKILNKAGDDVPVLQPIAVIGKPGEDWQAAIGAGAASGAPQASATEAPAAASSEASSAATAAVTPAPETSAQAPASSGENAAISPRARTLAFEELVDISTVVGTGPGGRIIEADIQKVLASRPPLTAAAKAELRSGGAIPTTGSGVGGRITLSDVAAAALARPQGATTSISAQTAIVPLDEYTDTPIKGIRKVIAQNMMQSLATTAQFTLNSSANATNMNKLRERFKASKPEMGFNKITVNDLVLFLASRILPQFSALNSLKKDGVIRTYSRVHLGVAVDTPRGLMVPVIRNADTLSLIQISQEAKALAEACINGSIKPDQLTGSTFTVSNLGNNGIESFTPVINIPEVAILGVCGMQPKPVPTADGGYTFEQHLGFSLTIDHAAVDGAPAARFLKAYCDAFRDIDLWIAR